MLGGLIQLYAQQGLKTGAERPELYLPMLKGKKVGLVAHQASLVNQNGKTVHLVDQLLEQGVALHSIFAPEHGFRGTADNGEKIKDQKDPKTGLPILSLYGKQRKPGPERLNELEAIVFDLQDVGARFYTYLSTLHYIMEACAENQIPLVVLDRPNPNAHYVDGPVLDLKHQSFVGMHPVPIVYGMTIGEYAKMINGEGWLKQGLKTNLMVVPIENYTHTTAYNLPVRPSPNLPNAQAIALYPSLCLLEPTVASVGRGTSFQFQIFGHPDYTELPFSFTPQPNLGAKYPKFKGQLCYGKDLRNVEKPKQISLQWLMEAYQASTNKDAFFLKGFARIAGVSELQNQIEMGWNTEQIRESWQPKLAQFKAIRKKYLIYP